MQPMPCSTSAPSKSFIATSSPETFFFTIPTETKLFFLLLSLPTLGSHGISSRFVCSFFYVMCDVMLTYGVTWC